MSHGDLLSLQGDLLSLHGDPLSSYGDPLSSYGDPLSLHGDPLSLHGDPLSSYGDPLSSHGDHLLYITIEHLIKFVIHHAKEAGRHDLKKGNLALFAEILIQDIARYIL